MVRVHAGPLEKEGGLAQLARAPALQAGGHRFDSDILHREKRLTGSVDLILMKETKCKSVAIG